MAKMSPSDAPKPAQPRWYTPTPAKFLFAVLAMQGALFLSAHYRWFWFNERKGYTVLITVAVTAIALLLLAGFVVVSRFVRSRAQFSLATLLLMVPVMGIPCGWLAREMELARRQTAIVEFVESRSGQIVCCKPSRIAPSIDDVWPLSTLGSAFFYDVLTVILYQADEEDFERLEELPLLCVVSLNGPQITDDNLEQLPRLKRVTLVEMNQTPITDAGLMHLNGLRELQHLTLHRTRVSEKGLKDFRESMPMCQVEYTNSPSP